MPAHRVEEWRSIILRIAGGEDFVCIGDFPDELRRKFDAIGVYYQQLPTIEAINGAVAGKVWVLREVPETEAASKLPTLVNLYQPARLFLEMPEESHSVSHRQIEQAFLSVGYRKSSDYHVDTEYAESCEQGRFHSFVRLAASAPTDGAGDPLRQTGRDADARTFRYHWASQFIRPYDIVLDLKSGTGYGASILGILSPCRKIFGWSEDSQLTEYAQQTYGCESKRLGFETAGLEQLSRLEDESVHCIVLFDSIPVAQDMATFFEQCKRILVPGGRLICSVPNQGCAENPVPTKHACTCEKIIELLSPQFLVERIFVQTAGNESDDSNGQKRSFREVPVPANPAEEAEWWVAVAMKEVRGAGKENFTCHFMPQFNGIDMPQFVNDYNNPWLIYSFVAMGYRATSPSIISEIGKSLLESELETSADYGSALCVLGYRYLENEELESLRTLIPKIEKYISQRHTNGHQHRWRISLEYLLGKIYLKLGDRKRAKESFRNCGYDDCLLFAASLGTKVTESLLLLGWLHYLDKDNESAIAAWQKGLEETQRIFKESDWARFEGRKDLPYDNGYAEMMLVLEYAQKCAAAIHSIRSGVFDSNRMAREIIDDFLPKNIVNSRNIQYMRDHFQHICDYARQLRECIQDQEKHVQDLEGRLQNLGAELNEKGASLKRVEEMSSAQLSYIKSLKEECENKERVLQKIRTKMRGA